MLIEVEDAEGGGSIAGQWYQKTNVIITDALPGYSAYGNVQKGDVSSLRPIFAHLCVCVFHLCVYFFPFVTLPIFSISRICFLHIRFAREV